MSWSTRHSLLLASLFTGLCVIIITLPINRFAFHHSWSDSLIRSAFTGFIYLFLPISQRLFRRALRRPQ